MSNKFSTDITGHLAKDATVSVTPSGTAILKFRMACNVPAKQVDGSFKDTTAWINVSRFMNKKESADKLAAALGKGSKVGVTGRMTFDPATGGPKIWAGQDGAARASFELIANDLEIHVSKPVGGATATEPPAEEAEAVGEEEVQF